MMDLLHQNACFLLWKEERALRVRWPGLLADILRRDEETAVALLEGARPFDAHDARRLRWFRGTDGDLTELSLVKAAKIDVYTENITFLFEMLRNGGHKALAEFVGRHPNTVSKWTSGAQRLPPRSESAARLMQYFTLPPGMFKLEEDCLFLWYDFRRMAMLSWHTWLCQYVGASSMTDLGTALDQTMKERLR